MRRPRWRTSWNVVAGGVLLLVAAICRYHSPDPVLRGTARSESLEIWTTGAAESRLPLPRAFVYADDVALTDMRLVIPPRTHLRFRRHSPDTLVVTVTAAGNRSGCIVRGQRQCFLPLGNQKRVGIVLQGSRRLLFPFHASGLRVGDVVAEQSEASTPLLLSGDVAVVDRTVSGDTFTSVSRVLGLGEAVLVAPADTRREEVGDGLLAVSEDAPIEVSFRMPASRAKVFRGSASTDVLSTFWFSRWREDWFVQSMWAAGLYLFVQPLAEVLKAKVSKMLVRKRSQA